MSNHSDRPNLCVQGALSAQPGPAAAAEQAGIATAGGEPGLTIRLRAIRDIAPGEELTICYLDTLYVSMHPRGDRSRDRSRPHHLGMAARSFIFFFNRSPAPPSPSPVLDGTSLRREARRQPGAGSGCARPIHVSASDMFAVRAAKRQNTVRADPSIPLPFPVAPPGGVSPSFPGTRVRQASFPERDEQLQER